MILYAFLRSFTWPRRPVHTSTMSTIMRRMLSSEPRRKMRPNIWVQPCRRGDANTNAVMSGNDMPRRENPYVVSTTCAPSARALLTASLATPPRSMLIGSAGVAASSSGTSTLVPSTFSSSSRSAGRASRNSANTNTPWRRISPSGCFGVTADAGRGPKPHR